MAFIAECGEGASLGSFATGCSENMGQIQKLGFQRVKNGAVKNSIATPWLLASWSPLLAAADSTKTVISPFLGAPSSTPGEERVFGGGNETLDGIEVSLGPGPSLFEAQLYGAKAFNVQVFQALGKEQLGVWFFDGDGQIGCLADDVSAPTAYYPVPIQALFVGDKGLGNYENLDMNQIRFRLKPRWSNNFVVVRASDFNPVEDLANADAPVDFNEDFGGDFA